MRVSAPVTDYIRASTMNTPGDLAVRGALVPERLATGAVNTFFRGQGAGVIPAYDNLGEVLDTYLKAQGVGVDPIFEKLALRDTGIKIGQTNRDSAGDQPVWGVGFMPSAIVFLANDGVTAQTNLSVGFDDGTVHMVMSLYNNGAAVRFEASYSIFLQKDASNRLIAYVNALGADGFTIHWVLVGAQDVHLTYLCLP